jgi:hypothetical protein
LERFRKFRQLFLFDTFGAIATASFLICAVSGIVLAVPYDVSNPFKSITLILITNPAASFFRNLHYWSAQFFLIFTILHIWDHLKAGTEKNQTHGIWLRLTFSILFVFFVMITGFLLKADTDSIQAKRIIAALIETIPLIGRIISTGLLGSEKDFQIVYIHHIATATIFLTIIIWEHARSLWTRFSTFLVTLVVITILSILFHAPINDHSSPVVKGPWYFVGLQEILHWVSNPGWVMLFILLIVGLVYLLYFVPQLKGKFLKKTLLLLLIIYLVLTVVGYFFRGENWTWQLPWQKQDVSGNSIRTGWNVFPFDYLKYCDKEVQIINGRPEACLLCHSNVAGLTPSHDPQALGCVSCHLGDPFSLNKKLAHRNMVLIPGNLANARQTCGTTNCHPEIIPRVKLSLMTTNSGIVSVDRFVFGEKDSPDVLSHIQEIGFTPAGQHLRNLCSNCHLGNEKKTTGSIDELSRGGGCNACHLNYSEDALKQHVGYLEGNKSESLLPKFHPSLDLKIGNSHCFGCHSRSGRISTNYEGWHETLLDEKEILDSAGFRILQDKRVFEFIAADIHHLKGLECIDCHGSYELMGDGKIHLHEENAVKISCEDCHSNALQKRISYENLDPESKKIFDLRKYNPENREMITTSVADLALINVFIENGEVKMTGKNSSNVHSLKPPASICTKDKVHASLTCCSCHTAWAPQCIGCHNEFDKQEEGYDLLQNKPVNETWVEYVGKYFAEAPALGVRIGEKRTIEPCVPGMILTIDKTGFPDFTGGKEAVFHRLFAPVAPHTTSAKGRNCKSCHNDPVTLGYGRGQLQYKVENGTGKWLFQPEFSPNKFDGLPEDAWIGFLSESNGIVSTRVNFKPFSVAEQQKILTVGACLTCHDENSSVILKSMDAEFSGYLKQISNACIVPAWKSGGNH